jgi:cytochrome c6
MQQFLCSLFFSAILIFVACGSAEEQLNRRAAEARTGSAPLTPDGMAVFKQYCVSCHGADGKLGLSGAKDLTASTLTLDERVEVITKGRKLMTPFGEVLTPEEIKAVAEYTLKLTPSK